MERAAGSLAPFDQVSLKSMQEQRDPSEIPTALWIDCSFTANVKDQSLIIKEGSKENAHSRANESGDACTLC